MSTANTSTKTLHDGHWEATATKSGTYEFDTAGKFVDRDIDLIVPQASISVSGSVSVGDVTVSPSVGTKSGTTYPLTGTSSISGSGTSTATVGTKGFTDSTSYSGSISASGNAKVNTTLPAGTLSASGTASATVSVSVGAKEDGKYPFTGSANISGTASASVTTEGYVRNETGSGSVTGTANVSGNMNTANPTVTGSATVLPSGLTAADGNAKISGSATTSQPTSGYYVAATPSTASSTTITQTKTLTTVGYLGTKDEITASGSVTGGNGSKYYIPITSGNIGVSATDPGTSYTENKTAIVPKEGWMTIAEGYYPKTKISLSTIIPDPSDPSKAAGAAYIRQGFIAFNTEGKEIVGTIPDSTTSGSDNSATANASASSTHNLSAGTYATSATTGYTYHVDTSASSSIGNVSASKTVTSGYLGSNTTVTASVTGASKSDSSNIYIKDSTSSIASGGTIPQGTTLTIGKGYYPSDRTFTAQSAAPSSGITGSLTSSITSGYTAPTLVTSPVSGTPYVTLTGNGSMNTGNIYNGTATADTKYLEVFSGTYSIV